MVGWRQDRTDVVDLLELFALCSRGICDLCEPVAILVDHGASAPGSAILDALSKARGPQAHDVLWRSLWRKAAKLLDKVDCGVERTEDIVAAVAALLVGGHVEPRFIKKLKAACEDLPGIL